jgi:hypothetical protein
MVVDLIYTVGFWLGLGVGFVIGTAFMIMLFASKKKKEEAQAIEEIPNKD